MTDITHIPSFEKDVRQFQKRFPGIGADLRTLIEKLRNHPEMGVNLGKRV